MLEYSIYIVGFGTILTMAGFAMKKLWLCLVGLATMIIGMIVSLIITFPGAWLQ